MNSDMGKKLESALSALTEAMRYLQTTKGKTGDLHGCAVEGGKWDEWEKILLNIPADDDERDDCIELKPEPSCEGRRCNTPALCPYQNDGRTSKGACGKQENGGNETVT